MHANQINAAHPSKVTVSPNLLNTQRFGLRHDRIAFTKTIIVKITPTQPAYCSSVIYQSKLASVRVGFAKLKYCDHPNATARSKAQTTRVQFCQRRSDAFVSNFLP